MKNYLVNGSLLKATSFRDAVRKGIEDPYGVEMLSMFKIGTTPTQAWVSIKRDGVWDEKYKGVVIELSPKIFTVNWEAYNKL